MGSLWWERVVCGGRGRSWQVSLLYNITLSCRGRSGHGLIGQLLWSLSHKCSDSVLQVNCPNRHCTGAWTITAPHHVMNCVISTQKALFCTGDFRLRNKATAVTCISVSCTQITMSEISWDNDHRSLSLFWSSRAIQGHGERPRYGAQSVANSPFL